nr:immunoglobulin heavy chain junction region [Macaca mulatta]MOV86997.1 immunoglobulin heavy chain junction region [Macaca mulatta]MOV87266.1 immunoglobulin heavy chain junction region [Macaca mulatta]MOV91125.1 immunoglobulin heavy chain junction region [Macaca mulatta]
CARDNSPEYFDWLPFPYYFDYW